MLRAGGGQCLLSMCSAQIAGPVVGAWTKGMFDVCRLQFNDRFLKGCYTRSAVSHDSTGQYLCSRAPCAIQRRFSTNGPGDPRSDHGNNPEYKTWIEKAAPASVLPYIHLARLHKPIGSWLLAWPCFWSIAMAAAPGQLPDIHMLTLYGTGAVVRRLTEC